MTDQSWIDHLQYETSMKITGDDPDRAIHRAEEISRQLDDKDSDLRHTMEQEAKSGVDYMCLSTRKDEASNYIHPYTDKEQAILKRYLSLRYPNLEFNATPFNICFGWNR